MKKPPTPGLFKRAIGSALASLSGWMGAYNSTDPRRKILEKFIVQKASANQALVYNLPTLVNQCRQLERNCPSARAAIEGLVADIIGTGIDVAPDTGASGRDDRIKKLWQEWCETAGAAGESLWELQAQACREIGTSGGPLWRFVILPERIAEGLLPLAILPLEIEWLAQLPVGQVAADTVFVNGIEIDKFGRPVAYHLIDPNLANNGGSAAQGERVPAKHICHGFERRRPGQSLGEPALAPLIERFKQEEDLVRIELKSAEIAANFSVGVTSEYHEDSVDDEDAETPEAVTDVSPGTITRFLPGEKAEVFQSSRPNQQIAPFRDMLRGDIAACARVSRKWLNRDYSSATFMNTRMEQDDATRMHKATQNWLGKCVASRPYVEVLPYIMIRLGLEMPADPVARTKLLAHRILPDLPGYVDPLKDGAAALQNIGGGLSTFEEECSKRGKDYSKIIDQHLVETAKADAAVVARIAALNKVIAAAKDKDPELTLDWSQVVTLPGATSAPGAYLDAIASAQMAATGNAAGNAEEAGDANAEGDKTSKPGDPAKKPATETDDEGEAAAA